MTETTRDGEPEQLLCSSQHTRRPDGNHEAKTRGTTLVLSSLTRFAALVANHSLRLREERLGSSYLLCDCHSYRVFRETVSPLTAEAPTVVEVGFRLRFIGSAAVAHRWFQRLCILTTPFWSGFDGFGTKLWMVDPRTFSYAGIYEWRDVNTARAYLAVLLPVLRAVSVPGSVFAELHPATQLRTFLGGREDRSIAARGFSSPG